MILKYINTVLDELTKLLEQLPNEKYSEKCLQLSGATIGEHTRHIIEMFQCLEMQYDKGNVNYDKRRRDLLIQSSVEFANNAICNLKSSLNKSNKALTLEQNLGDTKILTETNYNRELLYNLEHCIHHQALIKVALLNHKNIIISENFGVASSTIAHRNQCVQ